MRNIIEHYCSVNDTRTFFNNGKDLKSNAYVGCSSGPGLFRVSKKEKILHSEILGT